MDENEESERLRGPETEEGSPGNTASRSIQRSSGTGNCFILEGSLSCSVGPALLALCPGDPLVFGGCCETRLEKNASPDCGASARYKGNFAAQAEGGLSARTRCVCVFFRVK